MPIVRELIKFIIYILLQIFVFKDLILFGYAMSFIYVVYFITLPININRAYLMLIGFLSGFIIDIIYSTGGVHTFSSVMLTYFRPFIINRLIDSDKGARSSQLVSFQFIKQNDLAIYSLVIIFIHHTLVIFIEASSFHLFFYTLGKSIVSTLFTFILFLIGHYLVGKPKK